MIHVFILILTSLSIFLVLYHHIAYPALLKLIARLSAQTPISFEPRKYDHKNKSTLPHICIVIPAYNEAEWITDKISNLAFLDYPSDRCRVILACDGCTDNTANIARAEIAKPACSELNIEVREFKSNRGKIAVINDVITDLDTDLVALSDVSALISVDALMIAAAHFKNPNIGVLNSQYRILNPSSAGEENYWKYQCEIKSSEALLGSTLGAHGAFYMFRHNLFEPLDPDVINDDFVLPMQIVAKGYIATQDNRIHALELEKSNESLEQNRRLRISKGNTQQLLKLKQLLSPKYKGIAFAFASGKALRVLMPFLMIIAFLGSLILATSNLFFSIAAMAQTLVYGVTTWSIVANRFCSNRMIRTLTYILCGYIAGLRGTIRYFTHKTNDPWRRSNQSIHKNESEIIR